MATYSIPVLHLRLVREGSVTLHDAPQVRTSNDAANIFRTYLEGADREHFVVLLLNQKNRVIGIHTVAVGCLSSAIVHPREVFKVAVADPVMKELGRRAVAGNAAAMICCHNHPSGVDTPSNEDRALTARLVAAGTLLDIPVLDHIILGEASHYSFSDAGCLTA